MMTPDEIDQWCRSSESKIDALRQQLMGFESVLVAFSGGVDSAFMLKMALDVLGPKAQALTALSASVAPSEAAEAQDLAERLGSTHWIVNSNELSNPNYASNPSNRCYFCKSELYELCERKRIELGLGVVVDGFNEDDRRDHRPGHQAARERSVRSPLAEVGLTKKEIRAWSYRLGLPTWDKPQMPCLASRIPYGTQVTAERLTQIGAAEASLRAMGLRQFRVRFHGVIARLEVDSSEYPRFFDAEFRAQVNEKLRQQGFSFVALDLEPFRTGRLNELLPSAAISLPVVAS